MTKPNEYILGGTVQVRAKFTNDAGQGITPNEMRISVKDPTGLITTVSGEGLTAHPSISGMFYFNYRPLLGWTEYESWGKDGNGNEVVQTNGFEVTDRLYP